MADWGNVQQGMATGFQIGQKAGGKLSGLGVALKNVANQMVKKRETGEALGTLGQTERIKQEIGLEYDPEKRLKREIFSKKERGEELTPEEKKLGYGYTEEATTQSIVDKEGNVVGQRPTGSVFQPKEDPFNKYFFGGDKEPTISTGKKSLLKSPFPEYPDAFQENGVWKVMKNGKKYRIEDAKISIR